MPPNRYSSIDFYRVLVAIDARVRDLVCQGRHTDGGRSYKELAEYVAVEKEACAIRAAKQKSEAARRSRAEKNGGAHG